MIDGFYDFGGVTPRKPTQPAPLCGELACSRTCRLAWNRPDRGACRLIPSTIIPTQKESSQ